WYGCAGCDHRGDRGWWQGSGHWRRFGRRGGHWRGGAHWWTEGQDSFGNQIDVPVAEPRPAMRIAAGALVLLFVAGSGASAAGNDVMEGNPASPVKVLIYED